MYFRNVTFFRFDPTALAKTLAKDATTLNGALLEGALKPVGTLELSSRGWLPNIDSGLAEDMVHSQVGACTLVCLGGEDKILPAGVVAKKLDERIKAQEKLTGAKVGGRARKRIKEDLVHELLPQAFVQPSRLYGYLDLQAGIVAIDTASRKKAEGFITELRHALGSFNALPLNAEAAPRVVMTDFLTLENLDQDRASWGFTIGDEAELRDPTDNGAIAKLSNQELNSEEVRLHLITGKQASRLGVAFHDHVAAVMCEDMVLRKVAFLDGALAALDNTNPESWQAEINARFALMTAELRQVFGTLERHFKLSQLVA